MSSASASNYVCNVAVVGAGGNIGRYITESLLATGKHSVTALTRADSKTALPPSNSLIIKQVDYTSHDSLVSALQGIDALVITLSAQAPAETQENLISAAADANVPWILPNEWNPDTADDALLRDVPFFASKPAILRSIADKGTSSYIAVITGFWYHYMLGNPGQLFGVDFQKREMVFFDDGETLTCMSTWPQIGRAVAGLLSLPISISKEDRHAGAEKQCLDDFRNGYAYMRSFRISQREMFASVLRVTGTEESDWRISHQPARERFAQGKEQVANGDHLGMARAMTVRVFFADQREACGDFERTRGTVNELLKLPQEDLDEATKLGVERSKAPPQW